MTREEALALATEMLDREHERGRRSAIDYLEPEEPGTYRALLTCLNTGFQQIETYRRLTPEQKRRIPDALKEEARRYRQMTGKKANLRDPAMVSWLLESILFAAPGSRHDLSVIVKSEKLWDYEDVVDGMYPEFDEHRLQIVIEQEFGTAMNALTKETFEYHSFMDTVSNHFFALAAPPSRLPVARSALGGGRPRRSSRARRVSRGSPGRPDDPEPPPEPLAVPPARRAA